MSTVAASEFEFVYQLVGEQLSWELTFCNKNLGLTNSIFFSLPLHLSSLEENFYSCTYTEKKHSRNAPFWGSAPTFETQENSGNISGGSVSSSFSSFFRIFIMHLFLAAIIYIYKYTYISASHIIFFVTPLSFLVVNPPHNLFPDYFMAGLLQKAHEPRDPATHLSINDIERAPTEGKENTHMSSDQDWLVVSTHLKNISQIGNLPQIGMKIKHIWNHHLEDLCDIPWTPGGSQGSRILIMA